MRGGHREGKAGSRANAVSNIRPLRVRSPSLFNSPSWAILSLAGQGTPARHKDFNWGRPFRYQNTLSVKVPTSRGRTCVRPLYRLSPRLLTLVRRLNDSSSLNSLMAGMLRSVIPLLPTCGRFECQAVLHDVHLRTCHPHIFDSARKTQRSEGDSGYRESPVWRAIGAAKKSGALPREQRPALRSSCAG